MVIVTIIVRSFLHGARLRKIHIHIRAVQVGQKMLRGGSSAFIPVKVEPGGRYTGDFRKLAFCLLPITIKHVLWEISPAPVMSVLLGRISTRATPYNCVILVVLMIVLLLIFIPSTSALTLMMSG